jgi:hypothetical protein
MDIAMTKTLSPAALATILLVAGPLALTSCSNSREDVRVSFCKKLVLTQVPSPDSVTWTSVKTDPRRAEGLTVTLSFEGGAAEMTGRARQATCEYRFNAPDETAATLADPLSAYATSPERMTIDGVPLARSALAKAVGGAAILQGKAMIERAQHGLEEAADMARQRLESGESKP